MTECFPRFLGCLLGFAGGLEVVEERVPQAAVVKVVERWVQWAAVVVLLASDGRSLLSTESESASASVKSESASYSNIDWYYVSETAAAVEAAASTLRNQ